MTRGELLRFLTDDFWNNSPAWTWPTYDIKPRQGYFLGSMGFPSERAAYCKMAEWELMLELERAVNQIASSEPSVRRSNALTECFNHLYPKDGDFKSAIEERASEIHSRTAAKPEVMP